MRRVVGTGLLGLALLGLAAAPAEDPAPPAVKTPDALKEGKNLPGPFHPYNVTGLHRGHYHCPISERGLEPLVLVFVRNLEVPDTLKDLFIGLEEASEANPTLRLKSYGIFTSDDLPEVVGENDKNDDERDKLAEKLTDLDVSLKKPREVALCLAAPDDLKAYHLAETAEITVILCRRYRIVASHCLTRDQLDKKAVATILSEVAERLGAVKKPSKKAPAPQPEAPPGG